MSFSYSCLALPKYDFLSKLFLIYSTEYFPLTAHYYVQLLIFSLGSFYFAFCNTKYFVVSSSKQFLFPSIYHSAKLTSIVFDLSNSISLFRIFPLKNNFTHISYSIPLFPPVYSTLEDMLSCRVLYLKE